MDTPPMYPCTDPSQRGLAFPILHSASGWKCLIPDKPTIVQDALQCQPGRTSRTLKTDFSSQPELPPH